VLPIPGQSYPTGVGFAVSDDGVLDVRDLWPSSPGVGEALVVEALDAIATNATLRGGRLLAPLGIRYVVVPVIDGLQSTRSDPLPPPAGLTDAFDDQLDLRRSFYVSDVAVVYENTAVIPLRSTLTGAAAAASQTAGASALVRADLSGATPLMVGQEAPEAAQGAVPTGTFADSVPYDDRWSLTVDGTRIESRAAFGWSMAYEVPAAGTGRLAYDTSTWRTLIIGLQVVLWTATLLATSRFQGWRRRWRRRRTAITSPVITLDTSAAEVTS
jgi:hypothetical protein